MRTFGGFAVVGLDPQAICCFILKSPTLRKDCNKQSVAGEDSVVDSGLWVQTLEGCTEF